MSNSAMTYRLVANQEWKQVTLNQKETLLPLQWRVEKLSDVCKIHGGIPAPKKFEENGYPFIRVSNLHHEGAQVGRSQTKEFLFGEWKTVPKNTLLLAKSGESIRQHYRNLTTEESVIVGHIAGLEALPGYSIHFVRQHLRHYPFEESIILGGATPTIGLKSISNIEIRTMDESEQALIAKTVSTQEDRIEDLRAWAKTERQRLTWLTDELLSGRVRVVERQGGAETVVEVDENGVAKEALGAFELVANWEECKEIDINGKISKFPSAWMKQKISEHFEVSMGKTILSKDISKFDGDNLIPVFSATEDKKIFGYINRETLSASDLLDDGDIVIGARGTLGKPKLMTGPSTSTQTTIQCKSKNTLCSSLVVIIGKIDTSWFSTSGSGVPMLTAATVKNIEMALPSPPEQQRIAAVLSAQERQIEDIERLIAVEQKRLAWLTEELLSGRIRVEACND